MLPSLCNCIVSIDSELLAKFILYLVTEDVFLIQVSIK